MCVHYEAYSQNIVFTASLKECLLSKHVEQINLFVNLYKYVKHPVHIQ